MKTSQLSTLIKKLLPVLPGFGHVNSLIAIPPTTGILRGIDLEGSSFDKQRFYATYFAMPLCTPVDHLYFTYGSRVRHDNGSDGWDAADGDVVAELSSALVSQALPFLLPIVSGTAFVERAYSLSDEANPHTLKDMGLVLARDGHTAEAITCLQNSLCMLNPDIGWHNDIDACVTLILGKLKNCPPDAQKQLMEWEDHNLRTMRLNELEPRVSAETVNPSRFAAT